MVVVVVFMMGVFAIVLLFFAMNQGHKAGLEIMAPSSPPGGDIFGAAYPGFPRGGDNSYFKYSGKASQLSEGAGGQISAPAY